MENLRSSRPREKDDILELNIDMKGRLMVGDLGLVPREPYQVSKGKIIKTFQRFYERLSFSERSANYLVPMDMGEFHKYKSWKDSQV